jgi:hypothetical protein
MNPNIQKLVESICSPLGVRYEITEANVDYWQTFHPGETLVEGAIDLIISMPDYCSARNQDLQQRLNAIPGVASVFLHLIGKSKS